MNPQSNPTPNPNSNPKPKPNSPTIMSRAGKIRAHAPVPSSRISAPAALLMTLLIVMITMLAGCSQRRDPYQTLHNSFASPHGQPEILAAYQPWFGRPGHINVGYSSQDRVVLARQIEKAKNLGISAFVVNWYGASKDFEDHSYGLLQQLAAENNFFCAVMYDESDDPQTSTSDAIRDLQYAYERYISPQAPAHGAYLSYDGHPLIFIFPKGGKTDWTQVRSALSNWASPPLFIYKDINPRQADQFDGFYAWVHPDNSGWAPDGSNWGRQYLENFYSRMSQKYPQKIAVGAAWPGFDDSRASWSRNRRMSPRCGKTFEDSLRLFRRYYNDEHPLPFLMIVTWNDYEEGTAIEPGLQHC